MIKYISFYTKKANLQSYICEARLNYEIPFLEPFGAKAPAFYCNVLKIQYKNIDICILSVRIELVKVAIFINIRSNYRTMTILFEF